MAISVLTSCQQASADNWDELCALRDCERYPLDHSTIEIEGLPTFYFPILQVEGMSVHPQWFEVDPENHRLLRTLTDRPTQLFFGIGYSERILEHEGLLEVWPDTIDLPDEIEIVVAHRTGDRLSIDTSLRSLPVHPDKRIFSEFLAGDRASAPRLNDDFVIIYQSDEIKVRTTNGSFYREFAIYSIRPLVQGKHVIGVCEDYCGFFTVSEAEDQPSLHAEYSFGPMFRFGRVNRVPSIPSAAGDIVLSAHPCNAPNPVVICDGMDRAFADLGSALGVLDQILQTAQQRPTADERSAQ